MERSFKILTENFKESIKLMVKQYLVTMKSTMTKFYLMGLAVTIFFGCSTTNENETVIYQSDSFTVKNTTYTTPSVHIIGLESLPQYGSLASFDEGNELAFLPGTVKLGGDLNGDGIPELIYENITEEYDSVYGKTGILQITPEKQPEQHCNSRLLPGWQK